MHFSNYGAVKEVAQINSENNELRITFFFELFTTLGGFLLQRSRRYDEVRLQRNNPRSTTLFVEPKSLKLLHMLFAEVSLMRHLGDKSQNGFSVTHTRYNDYFDKLSKQNMIKLTLGCYTHKRYGNFVHSSFAYGKNLSKIRG